MKRMLSVNLWLALYNELSTSKINSRKMAIIDQSSFITYWGLSTGPVIHLPLTYVFIV